MHDIRIGSRKVREAYVANIRLTVMKLRCSE